MNGSIWSLGLQDILSTRSYRERDLSWHAPTWGQEARVNSRLPLIIADRAVENMEKTDEKNLNYMMSTFDNMYKLRRPDEIRTFLEDNDFLSPLISEAYWKLQNHFPNSSIFMQVDNNELVISVGTGLSPEEADEKLHNFDEEWWIDASENSNARLCITVEFQ